MTSRLLLSVAAMSLGLASVAMADTANVNVYGTINMAAENVRTGKASTEPSKFRITSNSSNVGVKGSEELALGLKGLFQAELSINTGDGTLSANLRNSGLGLTGNWGTVMAGKWDTPFKLASGFMEPFYGTGVGYLAAIYDTQPGGTSADMANAGATTDQSFNRRMGNSIQYWSPKMAGVTVKGMYSTNKGRTVSVDPFLYSLSVGYENGPLVAAVAGEMHYDFASATNHSRDMGLKAAVGYTLFDATTLGATATRLDYRIKDGREYSRNAYAFGATHKLDAFTLRAGYAFSTKGKESNAGAEVDTTGLGAKMFTIGGSYTLSKRTDLYAVASKIWNNPRSYSDFFINAAGLDGTAGSLGADPMALGVGIRTTF